MRIALVQVRIRARGRSANLSHVLRQVVRAAEAIPAPDLVVLPSCCDGLGHRGVSEAMAQGFGESLAAAAREWGMYVAAGFLRAIDGGIGQGACLYDPDGDAIAWAPSADQGESDRVFETPLGRVMAAVNDDDTPLERFEEQCDLLLLHGRWRAPGGSAGRTLRRLGTRLAQAARRTGAAVCAVGAVGDADDDRDLGLIGGTALYGADGQCLAEAGPGVEQTVAAEIARPATQSAS